MLKRLDRPVHIVFFADPMMRETVELYQLIAAQTPRVSVEFYDPMINPAQARMLGVNFAGTAVMESEGRRLPRSTAAAKSTSPTASCASRRARPSACASSMDTASRTHSAWSPTTT